MDKTEEIIQRLERLESLLMSETKPVLTHEEAAKFLGLSEGSLYKQTTIPRYKSGKRIYYKRAELVEWMTGNRRSSPRELKSKAAMFRR